MIIGINDVERRGRVKSNKVSFKIFYCQSSSTTSQGHLTLISLQLNCHDQTDTRSGTSNNLGLSSLILNLSLLRVASDLQIWIVPYGQVKTVHHRVLFSVSTHIFLLGLLAWFGPLVNVQ